jgi:hypothetical protein
MAAHRRRHAVHNFDSRDLDRLVAAIDPAIAEPLLVAGIAVAARDNWQAAAWLLARRHPSRWGPPSQRMPTTALDDLERDDLDLDADD